MKKYLVVIFTICIIFMGFVGFHLYSVINEKPEKEANANVETTVSETTAQPETTTPANPDAKVTLISLGDNLMHDSVISTGLQADGSYNYDCLFENIKSDIEKADIAIINQETMFGGSNYPYAGYPNFNSPSEVGDAEAKAGFDVILHATNHARDVWEDGIENCINFWETKHPDVLYAGINKSAEDQKKIDIIERNGLKCAVLNYTYGLNGYTLAEGKEYMVNLIDEAQIKSDIAKAKKEADVVIVFPHWGIEYQHSANEDQVKLAQMMADAGADLIIGTHPHVLQNIEWLNGKNGNKTLCYYSLGNYISGQTDVDTLLGGMAKITIERKNDKISISSAKLVPLVTYWNWNTNITRTYKLSEFTDELVATHGELAYDGSFSIPTLKSLAEEIVGKKWLSDK